MVMFGVMLLRVTVLGTSGLSCSARTVGIIAGSVIVRGNIKKRRWGVA